MPVYFTGRKRTEKVQAETKLTRPLTKWWAKNSAKSGNILPSNVGDNPEERLAKARIRRDYTLKILDFILSLPYNEGV